MSNLIKTVRRMVRLDQSGVTGLETAILLLASVTGALVLGVGMMTLGPYNSTHAPSTTMSGMEYAKSAMMFEGSVTLDGAISTGSPSIVGTPTLLTDSVNGDFTAKGVSIGHTIRNVTDGSSGVILSMTATTVTTEDDLQGGEFNTWATTDTYEIDMRSGGNAKAKAIPSLSWRTFQPHFQKQGVSHDSSGG